MPQPRLTWEFFPYPCLSSVVSEQLSTAAGDAQVQPTHTPKHHETQWHLGKLPSLNTRVRASPIGDLLMIHYLALKSLLLLFQDEFFFNWLFPFSLLS